MAASHYFWVNNREILDMTAKKVWGVIIIVISILITCYGILLSIDCVRSINAVEQQDRFFSGLMGDDRGNIATGMYGKPKNPFTEGALEKLKKLLLFGIGIITFGVLGCIVGTKMINTGTKPP